MNITFRVSVFAMLGSLAVAHTAAAQTPVLKPDPCAPHAFRWQDGCRPDAAYSGRAPWRSIALDATGASWLSLGGDYRVRVDSIDKADYGLRGGAAFTSLSQRLYLHGDIHTPVGIRVFAQLVAADEDGRKPAPRSVDETSPDIAQFFVDAPLGPAKIRIGRQEANFDGNRLVGLRDAAVRRTFDGLRLDAPVGAATFSAFYFRPVGIRPDAFNDRSSESEDFFGANLKAPLKNGITVHASIFDRRRDIASFASASGAEDRRTYSVRAVWENPRFDVSAQGAYQDGDIGAQSISAWGGVLDAGLHWKGAWTPRLGATLGYASGDRSRRDSTLNTFDPLYPNLSVFTEAPIYYPANQMNVEINLNVKPRKSLSVHLDAIYLARAKRSDAIYASSGRVLVPTPVGSQSSAVETEATVRWTISQCVELYGAFVHATPVGALDRAGGQDTDYALMQISTHF